MDKDYSENMNQEMPIDYSAPSNLDDGIEDYDDGVIKGETVEEGNKNYDLFFLTENFLYELDKNFRGYHKVSGSWVYTSDPIARDTIINQIMNAIRSIINPINMTSNLSTDDLTYDLLEKITEIIYTVYEEETVEDETVEHIINVCDHALQIFAGHIKEGHGSKFAIQMYSNIYHVDKNKKEDNKGFWDNFIKWN